MQRRIIPIISRLNPTNFHPHRTLSFSPETPLPYLGDTDDPLYADVPRPRRDKSERKPYPTPMKILIQRAKQEREARKAQPCRMLEHPPDNGLLVPELVPLAHRVYRARESLLSGLAKLVQAIPVLRCRFCNEVHVGRVGHEIRTCTGPASGFRCATHVWRRGSVSDVVFFPKCFHLYDRVGKPRVVHDERHRVPRIPAIVELCVQAGVDLEEYPTKRRTKPVYSIEGRIVDFEQMVENDQMSGNNIDPSSGSDFAAKLDEAPGGCEVERSVSNLDEVTDLRELSVLTMNSWLEMISGAKKIMEKYSVLTCGYCPEVQVGPKGHKVRMCKATKHQVRDGQHAWQEATIDDLVGPNYVWHVRDLDGPPLDNNLKRYYGKAPAAVELCIQAGAPVPDQYRSMMRLDVVPPDRDEFDLVA
ncbi:APO protein 3, mitochondrial [Turnera subulata]|uniref:APO protein 3, mitochondrial n=1 Tax=Turnera subulata TaxID=218843 RepID=A0A9Q0JEM3_9ROSI|nr:APO protein 3, mitochondrial [Turnera subulata]